MNDNKIKIIYIYKLLNILIVNKNEENYFENNLPNNYKIIEYKYKKNNELIFEEKLITNFIEWNKNYLKKQNKLLFELFQQKFNNKISYFKILFLNF